MRLLISAICLALVASCGQVDQEQKEAREKLAEMMDVHDEIMPKTMVISKRIEALQARADSTEQNMAYLESIRELDSAYNGMMDWMTEYSDLYAGSLTSTDPLTPEQLDQVDPQLEKVVGLRSLYEESFRRADSLLAE
jgi:predicted nuclease with TOPRIM domain